MSPVTAAVSVFVHYADWLFAGTCVPTGKLWPVDRSYNHEFTYDENND